MFKKVISKLFAVTCLLCVFCTSLPVLAATTYDVPSNNSFKSYMDYRTIKSKDTRQYDLRLLSTTTDNGLRIYNGRYLIAIGTGYNAPAGSYVDVTLDTGVVLQCVVGDIKANCDTDPTNKQDKNNNSVIEFVVDNDRIKRLTNGSGNVSSIEPFAGEVVSITVYGPEDMAAIDWQNVVIDFEKTNSYLVTDKYCFEVNGTTLYFVEYMSSTNYNTISVDKETYDSLTVNNSVIALPE